MAPLSSSSSFPKPLTSTESYWQQRQLHHAIDTKFQPIFGRGSASGRVTQMERVSYSPSRRWVLYRWQRSKYGTYGTVRMETIFRVVPISYIDDDALQDRFTTIRHHQQQQKQSQRGGDEGDFQWLTFLPYSEYFDELDAMGDILSVSPSPFPLVGSSSLLSSSFLTAILPSPSQTTTSTSSTTTKTTTPTTPPLTRLPTPVTMNIPIWRYNIGGLEVNANQQGYTAEWHEHDPCTLVIKQFNESSPSKAADSALDDRSSPVWGRSIEMKAGRSNQQSGRDWHNSTPLPIAIYHCRLPQRDIDKPIWLTTLDHAIAHFTTIPSPLLDIIFDYFDC
jgi:hypothetical protein